MAIAKTLEILLRAPTSQLDKDFKKGQQAAQAFFKSMSSLAGMFTAGLSVAGFVSQLNSAFTTLDGIAKRAFRLNVDVSELRNLDLAAEMSGMAVGSLDTAFVRLSTNINDAQQGMGQAVKIFGQLGVNAQDLVDLSFPEQLQKIAHGLDRVEAGTQRAAVAIRLFGRSGLQLLPLLANQGNGIVAAMQDAQRLGGFVSNAEAARVEAANDAFSKLTFTVRSLFQRMAVDLAPALFRVFANLSEAIKPGTALNQLFVVLGNSVTLVTHLFAEFLGFVSFLSEATGRFGGTVLSVVVGMYALNLATKTVTATYRALLIVQAALAKVETLRAKLNPATLALAGAALTAYAAFSEQINAAIVNTLGLADAQQAVNDKLGDFNQLQTKANQQRTLNLGSAGIGSQAALEQMLTVRSTADSSAPVVNAVNQGNDILQQIRDGLQGVRGMFNFDDGEDL